MNDTINENQMPVPTEERKPSNKRHLFKIIISIVVIAAIAVTTAYFFKKSSDPASIAVSQLNLLKRGDIKEAYDMTSSSFKRATSFDVFESYVNNNTIFNDYKKIEFDEKKLTENGAYLKGIIEGEDGGQMTAEYQLMKEADSWKIQAIRLTPIALSGEAPMQTSDATTTKPSIHGILISDQADTDGYVEDNKTVIPRDAKKIFATVMLVSPEPDITVSTTLQHPSSGAKLGPIESKTTKTGNIMKAFSFTREKQLWPAGEYEILVQLSSGDTQSLKFEIK